MTTNAIPRPSKSKWTKAIPETRDRLQSRALVCIMAPLLCAAAARAIAASLLLAPGDPHRRYLFIELAISAAFAFLAWRLKAATGAAAACGGVICLLLSDATFFRVPSLLTSGLPPLILLFVLTFLATRYGRARKEARGLAEPRTGRRTSQVIANLGVAALCYAIGQGKVHAAFFQFAAVAALAEATADTLSSEIGQAIGGPAYLITNLRRCAPGTDGAISVTGTLAGLIGAAAVAITPLVGDRHPLSGLSFVYFGAVFSAAGAGLFFDSLLGATIERKGWIGNDLVNFLSTAFSAAAALLAIRLFPP